MGEASKHLSASVRGLRKMTELPEPGQRVRLMKRTIEDIPYGHLGTVVGHTRVDGTGSIIVGFDDIPCVRYLKRSDLHRVESDA